jgi:hypothetical protein
MMYHIDHDDTEKIKLDLVYETHLLEVEGYPIVTTMFHKLLSVADLAEWFQFHVEIDILSGNQSLIVINIKEV